MRSKINGKTLSTRQKILFLQKYINSKFPKLLKHHPENITGLRIDKKVKNGKEQRNYSVIFHVEKKIGHSEVKEIGKLIPPFLNIKFPDGKTRKIKTDVEETGKFMFHLGIGDEINCKLNPTEVGSVGLFLKDEHDRVFVLTNYHVVARKEMKAGRFEYERNSNQKENVTVRDLNGTVYSGRLECGVFSSEIDAAFAELFVFPDDSMNSLPDGSNVQGYSYQCPFKNSPVTVYSYYNRGGRSTIVKNQSAVFRTGFNDKYISDTILIERCTDDGDSGGLVVTSTNSVLGIVTGGDNNYTYVIPYYKIINDLKIENTKSLTII